MQNKSKASDLLQTFSPNFTPTDTESRNIVVQTGRCDEYISTEIDSHFIANGTGRRMKDSYSPEKMVLQSESIKLH